jgi:hypothetical protein
MATVRKIKWKVHCTPQEKINFSAGERWYLDSDCGRKLTGEGTVTAYTDSNAVIYVASQAISGTVELQSASGTDNDFNFMYVKNLGGGSGDDVMASPGNNQFAIRLSVGEAWACRLANTGSQIDVKCDSGDDTTIEYLISRKN